MDILYLMILCSVSVAAVFLVIFIISARRGQFEDDESPAVRMLFDDEVKEDQEEQQAPDTDKNNKKDKEKEKDNQLYGNTKVQL
ncbi:cbb3-type cytochrome oxidase assembly protein CcoS [Daejeonia sp. YH14]|uniref:cbb3-type cytochrome oxidase assembly protein CcoS n=1 Tax=Daejeonia sp. YH14 TaxID=3439042 RepID=UPI003F490B80